MKFFILTITALLLTGCGLFGTARGIDVPKRMSQAQELGNCEPKMIYEKTEQGEYKTTHEFAMVCK
jgi:hypothetical protein